MTFADKLRELRERATQGDWAALPEECDKPYIRIRGTLPGSRYKIANVITPVYEGVHKREAEETRANAKLITFLANHAEKIEALVRVSQKAADMISAEYCSHSPIPCGDHDKCYAQDIYRVLNALEKEQS